MGEIKIHIDKKSKEVSLFEDDSIISYDSLPKGFYKVDHASSMFFTRYFLTQKEDLMLPTSAKMVAKYFIDYDELARLFSDKNKSICKTMNLRIKTGYLFHGIQGSGKSTLMAAIATYFNDHFDGATLLVDDFNTLRYACGFIAEIHKKDPGKVFTILMDECESWFADNENNIKPILDGLNSPNNIIFLAATNHIRKIPDTIKDRPSRFKHVYDISTMTEPDIILNIISDMNTSLEENYRYPKEALRDLVEQCIGKTLDQIKNIFIDNCFNEKYFPEVEVSKKKSLGRKLIEAVS